MPALPLDEAGKYVAGAYVVFVALLLIYVAIMAVRLSASTASSASSRRLAGISDPRNRAGQRRRPRAGRRRGLWLSCSRSASRTRPRRWSCASGWRSPRAARSGCSASCATRDEVLEAAAISTCNRTELYLYRADPVGAESAALGLLSREADIPPTELVGISTRCGRRPPRPSISSGSPRDSTR